jgi:hypothetical protein
LKLKTKIFLGILFCIFYLPGYFFLYKEIGNTDFSLSSIVLGSFFTLFGILGHSALIFEKQFERFENNQRQVNYVKYFFKVLGTIILLPLGVFWTYALLFQKSDNIKQQDLTIIKGTLSKKPEFKRGSKSSTYLNIYLNEYPEFTFEPMYDEYLHYNTSIEDSCEIGDTITIGIEKDDYDKDIAKINAKSFIEKHVNQHLIMTYYIEKNGNIFYHPIIHNQLDKEDKELGKYLVIIGIIPILSCVSIWLSEILFALRNNGYIQLADKLEKYRKRKII